VLRILDILHEELDQLPQSCKFRLSHSINFVLLLVN